MQIQKFFFGIFAHRAKFNLHIENVSNVANAKWNHQIF